MDHTTKQLQELNSKVTAYLSEIAELKTKNETLAKQNSELEAAVKDLKARLEKK